jgi:hypothetical protein
MMYECFVQDTPQHHDHLVEELWESYQEGCPGIDYTLLRNNLRDISSTTVSKQDICNYSTRPQWLVW